MKIIKKKKEEYEAWKAKNANDGYGSCCFRYAEAWADEMELAIAQGKTIADVARKTSKDVDRRPEFGITGFMYGMAVAILSQSWIHGEELRRWHNLDTQIGDEGERANEKGTVLNPALLSIGKAGS